MGADHGKQFIHFVRGASALTRGQVRSAVQAAVGHEQALTLGCDRARVWGAPRLVPDVDEELGRTTWGVRGGVGVTLELALTGAVPAIEGAYALSLVDDGALKAFEFASAESSLPELMGMAERVAADPGATASGAVARLSGYVAERRVAAHFVERGATVEFPRSAAQPGYDLLVDGHAVQVKCLADAGGVLEHLERYPDIPVVANVELAHHVGHLPGVLIDDELSHAEVAAATHDSLHGLDLLDDDGDAIPLVSLASAAVRHGLAWRAGRITVRQAASRTAADGLVVGGLARLGALAGGALGAYLGTGAVVAGAVVLSMGGAEVGRALLERLRNHGAWKARGEAAALLGEFGTWMARDVLPDRTAALYRRRVRARQAERTAPPGSLARSAAGLLLDESDAALARTRRAQGYMNRVAFSREEDDRLLAGWVAVRYAPHVFHPQLDARWKALLDAVQRFHDEAKEVS